MSLEQAITALTEAVKANTAALGGKTTAPVAAQTAKPTAVATTSKPAVTGADKPAATKPAATKPAAVKTAASADGYEAVKAATLKLSKEKGRAVAEATLKEFGVTNAPQLKPEQYDAYVAAVEAHFATDGEEELV